MRNDSIGAVLTLLRRLQATQGLSLDNTPLQFLQAWGNDHSLSSVLRLCLAVQEQLELARLAIDQSALSAEAKLGLLATLNSLQNMFGLDTIYNSAIRSHLPAVEAAITNFAIISSMVDGEWSTEALTELQGLISEVDDLIDFVRGLDIDPVIRETTVKLLYALAAMLRNAQAVGIDAAITAYFEVVLKLRRFDTVAADETKEATVGIWAKMATWSERFQRLGDLVDTGQKFIPYVEKVPDLLKYAPF